MRLFPFLATTGSSRRAAVSAALVWIGTSCGMERQPVVRSGARESKPPPPVALRDETTPHAGAPVAVESEPEETTERLAAIETEKSAAAPHESNAPRLTSRGYVTWIWPRPQKGARYLGYIRVGSSVALRSTEIVKGAGCREGFYAIEPRGYVCRDHSVTLSPEPWFEQESAATAPAEGPLPYRYALSNGAPMYRRIPTVAEQRRAETKYGPKDRVPKLPKFLRSHEDLATSQTITGADPVPTFLSSKQPPAGLVRRSIPHGSMLSFTRAFEAEDRTWLLSVDGLLVPADRMRLFEPSTFRGVRLGEGVELPIAWIRKTSRPSYRRDPSGAMVRAGELPLRSFVALSEGPGRAVEHGGKKYLELAGGEAFVAERDATIVTRATKLPLGVRPGQKWVLVRITDGTLVAYEGLTPVYATLISPGAGGVPTPGADPVRMSTTPLGVYNVTFKDRAATMSPEQGEDRTFWIADVPFTQYFNPPFALHAAYWHERFGEPTSGGCINLSPIDAHLLFEWSDPQVPSGWQGATGAGATENGPTTAVVVRR